MATLEDPYGDAENRPEDTIAERFRLASVPTVLTSRPARSPILISHVVCETENHGANRVVPSEDAYVANVILRDLDAEIWLQGKRTAHRKAGAGGLYVFDLQSDPVVHFRSSFEMVRFYISRSTLDSLARDAGMRPRGSLGRPDLGAPDPVMHNLARAMIPALKAPAEVSQLYVDYVSLAFHAHLMGKYAGPSPDRKTARPGLSSWQARTATDLIASRLDGKVSVSELAAACNLSQSHFSRAFVQTFGMPPHRWLLEQRVIRAKDLIEQGALPLTAIALECGFASQSHLSRVFAAVAGTTPSKWRRRASRLGPLQLTASAQ